MYELYKQQCVDKIINLVSVTRYRQVFMSEFNLGLGTPKSDICKTCDSKEDNDGHVARCKAAFKEQDNDRNLVRKGTILFFPEVEHNVMDIDRDFDAEKKVIRKAQNVYTVDQCITLMGEARKRNLYVIKRMEDKFVNLKELSQKLNLIDKKKSNKGETITLRNVQ
ncbi:hypothetical protein ILUMI_14821 [Ignelater luminosus]|uniref:Uncharacterized protein n=1 Tax=Ignelater luminosus TaxID=2038154 RepID=A0A8K0CVV0_IGNLU|nr:hypothetical protein ILUMI_14821 [Ignelater luminosus]